MAEPRLVNPQAGVFGEAAMRYERGRPPYPREAVDWLLPPGARSVLDLGAGTGKLTRRLLGRGLERVIAVEPLSTWGGWFGFGRSRRRWPVRVRSGTVRVRRSGR